MNSTKLTPTQRYAEETAERTVDDNLAMIKFAKRMAMLIVYPVMAASYQHQRHYLLERGADTFGATILPIVFDLAIIFCVKVIGTTGMAKPAKFAALAGMLLPTYASARINFEGSPNSTIGWVYVGAIAMIAVIETIKALMKPDPKALRAAEVSMAQTASAEPTIDDAATQRRREAAKKGAAKRAENRAAEAARKAAALAKRRAKRIAPDSPPWVIEERQPTAEELAAIHA